MDQFLEDVRTGLLQHPRKLPSKYFYDEEGSRLFQQIMELPEYYLTRAEFEILQDQSLAILNAVRPSLQGRPIDLIELGAGDGLKTKLLIEQWLDSRVPFRYLPIDISGIVLQELEHSIHKQWPELTVKPLSGDYFAALSRLHQEEGAVRVVLFLGSNIGNFSKEAATVFLKHISDEMDAGDFFLLGADLKKNPERILAAYHDASGVTAAFNLNLLHRINRELDADFEVAAFRHYPFYNIETGEVRSYLVSTKAQKVHIKKADLHVEFQPWEYIHTEISKKYDFQELAELAESAGFESVAHFQDSKRDFVDTLWRKC